MKNILKNQSGNTLFEVIIYVAILGMIVVSFISFTLAVSSVRNKSYVMSEVNSNLRIASDLISQKVRSAENVLSPLAGNSGASLSLDMPNPEPSLDFSLSDGVLYLVEDGITSSAITSSEVNITQLSFENISANGQRASLQVKISGEYRANDSREFTYTNSLKTTVNIRK
ncbi:MAG: hypothetical protein Q7T50_03665 [Candidatus Magasanikbacteria bacterium]|nr:hypothetical protein [Candidatus Magasanikbacteria bacterium]